MCVGAYVCVVCADSLLRVPQDKWSVVLDLFSNLEWVRFKGLFLSTSLKHVITLRGPSHG